MREDLRTAIRSLRASRTFTAVALVIIALGIGASTAMFSIVDAVVLRGLPFDEHDRLVAVLEHDTKRPTTFGGGQPTPQMYLDWRRLQESFEAIAGAGNTTFQLRNENGEPADARGQRVTHEFFSVFRVTPLLGRAFTPEDEIEGRHRVALLSYGFWQRRFGGSPEVVGKTIELDDESWEIVGVMPRGFAYPVASDRPTEIYSPISFGNEQKTRGGSRNYNWGAVARLKPGITVEQAHEQMNRVAEALDRQYPEWSPGRRARVISLHEHLVGKARGWMLMLLGAVILVLLIACANVANLMLARATVRTREMAIRAALGAGRWRLVRGLLVEGVLLSLAGAAIGILLAYFGVQVLRDWLPAGVPRVAAIELDLRVVAVAIAAAIVTGVFFGIVPAVHSSRPDLTTTLKDSGRSATAGRRTQWLRGGLVIAEMALAVVLLVGAGLFIGSFINLMRIDPGFDYRNLLVLHVGPSLPPGPMTQAVFQEALKRGGPYAAQMLEAVRAVPGVAAAAAVNGGVPLTGGWNRSDVELPGRGELTGDDDSIDRRDVSAGYFQMMRIPLRRGRYLSEEDTESSQRVAVVNEAAARKYWPGEDALGKRFKVGGHDLTVVGIVGDIRHLGPEAPVRQECYVPMTQTGVLGVALMMRTHGDPVAVLPAVRTAIWSVNRNQRLTADLVTLEQYIDRLIAQRRFNMALLATFGLLGLMIAAVGIYGVMSYVVAQRTNEIGVRMALGATRKNVVSMVLARAALLMIAGLALGAGAAWLLSAGVEAFLFQVEPTDVRIFIAAVGTLTAAGLLASALPARRAAAVDPLAALRHE